MSLQRWVSKTASYYRRSGFVEGTRQTAENTIQSLLGRVDPYINGSNIYDGDWELLIIVDACRSDLLQYVAAEYDWLPETIETRRSVGCATRTWMQRTFTSEHKADMAATDYVVANPYSSKLLDESEFNTLDEVHQYAWDNDIGTVHPRPVTERAVHLHRTQGADRLLVHYLPPHFPSIPDPLGYNLSIQNFLADNDGSGVYWNSVWDALREGEISRDRVWEAYRANLMNVLDDIGVLLANVDAECAILTSDHGNAFGEWWTYGHPARVYNPVNRRIPFVRVDASDERTLEPSKNWTIAQDADSTENPEENGLEDRLAALGYR